MSSFSRFILFLTLNFSIFAQPVMLWHTYVSYVGMTSGKGVQMVLDNFGRPVCLLQVTGWEQTKSFSLYKMNSSDGSNVWYSGSLNADAKLMYSDSSGNIFIYGRVRDDYGYKNPFITKFSSTGTRLYFYTEPGPPFNELLSVHMDRFYNSYLLTAAGSFFKIQKFDSSGTNLVTTFYGGTGQVYPVAITSNNFNEIIAAGYEYTGSNYSLTFLKMSSIGEQLDTGRIIMPVNGAAGTGKMFADANNLYLMSAYNGTSLYLFMKLNSSFDTVWTKTDPAPPSAPHAVFRVQSDGSVIRNTLNQLVKYNSQGIQQWAHTINVRDIYISPDNYIYAAGSQGGGTYYVCKLSQDGTIIWDFNFFFGSYTVNEALSVGIDSTGDVFVFGHSLHTQGQLIVTRKYSQFVGITAQSNNIPLKTSLYQNYPNPFNPSTTLKFDLKENSPVRLAVYDFLGREVFAYSHSNLPPGTYSYDWDASQNSSGIYFAKLTAGNNSFTRRMVLVK